MMVGGRGVGRGEREAKQDSGGFVKEPLDAGQGKRASTCYTVDSWMFPVVEEVRYATCLGCGG